MTLAPTWLLAAAAVLAAAALFLLLTGLRPRRTGDTRFCRRCRYNLTGLDGATCPECGADLAASKAVVIGARIIRRPRVIAGAVLLTILAAAVTTAAIGHARKIDWYAHYPASWVLADLNSGNPTRAGRALMELIRREQANKLSPAHSSQLIEFCLARLSCTFEVVTHASDEAELSGRTGVSVLDPTRPRGADDLPEPDP